MAQEPYQLGRAVGSPPSRSLRISGHWLGKENIFESFPAFFGVLVKIFENGGRCFVQNFNTSVIGHGGLTWAGILGKAIKY